MRRAIPLFVSLLFATTAFAQGKPKIETLELKSPVRAGVLVVDLDGDQRPEILVSQLNQGVRLIGEKLKWSAALAVGRATPAAGDLDKDGKIELVVPYLKASKDPKVRVSALAIFDAQGQRKGTFSVPGEVAGAVVLSDLDGDGKLELLMATIGGKLVVLDAKGNAVAGFPKDIANVHDVSEVTILASPVVGELDGDRKNGPEIAVATNGGKLYAFHRNGESLPRFPVDLKEAVLASPLIGDVTGDGKGEILVVTAKGTVELRKPDGTSHKGFPVKLGQPVSATPLAYDLDGDGAREIYVGTLGAFVFGISPKGKPLAGWPRKVEGAISASLLAGDVDGDSSADLLVATRSGKLYAFMAKGLTVQGYPMAAGGVVYATPALADFSGSGKAQWIVARQDRKLSIVEDPRPSIQALRYSTPWASFQGGYHRSGSLDNVKLPSSLHPPAPRPTNPPRDTDAPKNTAEPNPPSRKACGCEYSSARPHSLDIFLSLLGLMGLVLLMRRSQL